MTSTALARQSATISTNAARLAMGAIVAYQLLLSALIFLRPDLAPSWHTISEWAIGRYGWIMSGQILPDAHGIAALGKSDFDRVAVGAHALAEGLRPGFGAVAEGTAAANSAPKSVITSMAGFAQTGSATAGGASSATAESVITCMAGLAGDALPIHRAAAQRFRPLSSSGGRLTTHPNVQLDSSQRPSSRPNAMTCCFFSSFKTLLTLTEVSPSRRNQCPERCLSLAGFQVIMYGRFWVFTEAAHADHCESTKSSRVRSQRQLQSRSSKRVQGGSQMAFSMMPAI